MMAGATFEASCLCSALLGRAKRPACASQSRRLRNRKKGLPLGKIPRMSNVALPTPKLQLETLLELLASDDPVVPELVARVERRLTALAAEAERRPSCQPAQAERRLSA